MGILTVGDELVLPRNPPAVRQELPLKAQSAIKILKLSRQAATSDLYPKAEFSTAAPLSF
jgi:hypothetical protein